MGVYVGKIRALGSAIRAFKGASGGVIPWIKLFNDTAIAVNQLGVRNGSVAVWIDAWHRDLPEFLQIRTNNGDDRKQVFKEAVHSQSYSYMLDTICSPEKRNDKKWC